MVAHPFLKQLALALWTLVGHEGLDIRHSAPKAFPRSDARLHSHLLTHRVRNLITPTLQHLSVLTFDQQSRLWLSP